MYGVRVPYLCVSPRKNSYPKKSRNPETRPPAIYPPGYAVLGVGGFPFGGSPFYTIKTKPDIQTRKGIRHANCVLALEESFCRLGASRSSALSMFSPRRNSQMRNSKLRTPETRPPERSFAFWILCIWFSPFSAIRFTRVKLNPTSRCGRNYERDPSTDAPSKLSASKRPSDYRPTYYFTRVRIVSRETQIAETKKLDIRKSLF